MRDRKRLWTNRHQPNSAGVVAILRAVVAASRAARVERLETPSPTTDHPAFQIVNVQVWTTIRSPVGVSFTTPERCLASKNKGVRRAADWMRFAARVLRTRPLNRTSALSPVVPANAGILIGLSRQPIGVAVPVCCFYELLRGVPRYVLDWTAANL